ncbi:MAG TPA: aldehyde dehydrogenase family protein, partial [Pseudolabrys sp.]|nr:aldehyde dehydrogenase family protein [Pseudolabrys sp.]
MLDVTRKQEQPSSAPAVKEVLNFIGGEYRPANSGKTFEKRSPVDGALIARVSEAGEAEVNAAVTAACGALQGEWGKLTGAQRGDLLYALVDGINARFDDFLAAEIADTGKPMSLARHLDIPRGAANFKVFADTIKNVATEFFEMATPDGAGAINYAVRRPVGVVGVICPWNLPLLLMTWKVAPAMACGNTVVVKPSEESPQTAALLGEVMNAAGIPKGVYNVVHGFGPDSAGEFLTRHPGVNAITFTGETRTGAAIMKAAADGARPVSLEMGGKNPAIVFADCDLDAALEGTMRSCFANCGQVCLGTERVYVERPLFDTFVAALKERTEKLKLGRPEDGATTMGPLISHEHREK